MKNNIITNNSAQISIFVIIGAIILTLGISIILLSNISTKTISNDSLTQDLTQPKSFEEFVESCIIQSTKNQAIYNLQRGGYVNQSLKDVNLEFINVSIYKSTNFSNIPTLSIFEKEIADAMSIEFDFCIKNFTTFKEVGYEIEYSKPSFNVDILENEIITISTIPISMKYEEKDINFLNFQTTTLFNIKSKYENVLSFIEAHNSSFNEIPIGSLIKLSNEYDFIFEMSEENEYIIYSFFYEEDNDIVEYAFAIGYNFIDEEWEDEE